MLNEENFLDGLELLNSYFEKRLDEKIIPIWKTFLDKELSDDEFTDSVNEAILSLPMYSYPTAKQLVGFAHLGNETKAMYEWRSLVVPAAAMGSEEGRNHLLAQLSHRGRIALQLVGGIRKVESSEEKWIESLGREFKTAYCQSHSGVKVLPPAKLPPIEAIAEESPEKPLNLQGLSSTIQEILERTQKLAAGQLTQEESFRSALSTKGWQIDDRRFTHFLESVPDKSRFLEIFAFQIKQGRSPSLSFDKLSGYKPSATRDSRALAEEWLQEVEF
jgi:hypothetical protein